MNPGNETIAYFSMEIGLAEGLPTYSGGLGVLAGDTVRSAADAELAMVAVTLVHRQGYFQQHLAADGAQSEAPQPWAPEQTLSEAEQRTRVSIEGRDVTLRAWRFDVKGVSGAAVPVFLLDRATCPKTRKPTATSPTFCTAATSATACARKSFWASAACDCRALSATPTFGAST